MTREARSARRGPKPNPEHASPSGYRVSDRTRFELQVAAAFVGTSTLQGTIDLAVKEFLTSLREHADGYAEALDAAERNQQRRGRVARLGDPSGSEP